MGAPREVVSGTAAYSCKTRERGITEQWTQTRAVSVSVGPDDDAAAKLAEKARELTRTIAGCHDVKFVQIVPEGVPETAKAALPQPAAPLQPVKVVNRERMMTARWR